MVQSHTEIKHPHASWLHNTHQFSESIMISDYPRLNEPDPNDGTARRTMGLSTRADTSETNCKIISETDLPPNNRSRVFFFGDFVCATVSEHVYDIVMTLHVILEANSSAILSNVRALRGTARKLTRTIK